jgi:large subunit ribosomal protein LP2
MYFLFIWRVLLTLSFSAAYLLAVLGGNSNPDEATVNKILGAVGLEADKERLNKLLTELKGKVRVYTFCTT